VVFFDIEGKLWKSRGLWLRRLAEKGLQYSAQCPLILANSNSIAVVYKTQCLLEWQGDPRGRLSVPLSSRHTTVVPVHVEAAEATEVVAPRLSQFA